LPEYRGGGKELMFAFEKKAKELGCQRTAMIHMVDSMPDILENFYLKNGYKLIEKHYVKEI
jgi:GNAT superfamily N-acetyltransferase